LKAGYEVVPTENKPVGETCKVTAPKETIFKDKKNCTATVNMTSCDGTCKSKSIATGDKEVYSPECKCCQPTAIRKRSIILECPDGSSSSMDWHEIHSCACKVHTCTVGNDLSSLDMYNEQGIYMDTRKRSLPMPDKNIKKRSLPLKRRQKGIKAALLHKFSKK